MRNTKFPPIVAVFAAAIAIFSAANFAQAADNSLLISEVLVSGNSADEEFIEIYNTTSEDINLALLPLKLHIITSNGKKDTLKNLSYIGSNSIIKSHNYFLLASSSYENTHSNIPVNITYSAALVSNGAVYISTSADRNSEIIDLAHWGTTEDWSPPPANPKSNYSLERIDNGPDWQESCETGGTPGKEPTICETESDSSPEDNSTEDSSDSDDKNDAPKKVYSKNLKITELLPNPSSDEDTGEFTEIYNADPKEIIELSGWKLEDKTGNSYLLPDISINPGEYLAFYRNNSAFSLNNTKGETVFLKDPNGEEVSKITYSGTVKEDYAYALWGSDFLWTSAPTPGAENIFDTPAIEASIESSIEASMNNDDGAKTGKNIFLNEIFPNPKDGSDGEYIEIMNGGSEAADLIGWRIKDASKSKGYQFKEHIILNPGEYLAIYRPDSKIALNNSDESVYLLNPKGEIVSSVTFEKSLKNASYNFDGEVWKWSKYLTPGKENKFDSKPSVKITKPKKIYKDIVAEFSAKAKDKETKKLKYAWDFGDGKKSNLAKTSHKYLDTGKYTVTLSVSDDSQTVEKSFSLKVKKSPRPNIEIVKIVPNPAGNDSEGEIVEIKNNSKKKIDLTGWKIATGSGEKIYNHPISGEISVDSNETKTITREFSKFSLNNKAGKVGLVMPDGKVIDEIAYSKEKISEDEAYAKINGEWQWIAPGAPDENTDESVTDEESESEEVVEEDIANNGEVLGAANENMPVSPSYRSYFSSEDAFIFLSKIGFLKSQNKEINYCPLKNTTASLEYFLISSI